jgi:hypothetical protein
MATEPDNKQKETNSSLQHKAKRVLYACTFIKRLCGYFIYSNTVQVVDNNVNQKEQDNNRLQR